MSHTGKKKSLLEECIFTARLLLGAFSLLLFIASLTVELSFAGHCLTTSQFIFTLFVVAPIPLFHGIMYRTLGLIALMTIIISLSTSALKDPLPPRQGRLLSIGSNHSIGSFELVSERDVVLLATRILPYLGGMSVTEADGLLPALTQLYQTMETERRSFSSPLTQSIIGIPYIFNSETLSFDSKEHTASKRAIVFLHGVGGNWSLLCWLLSQAGESIHATTYCPSLGVLGTWGSDRGKEIMSALFKTLEAEGKTEIYLIGISAGAVGAAQIAHQFENKLHALALISGSHPIARELTLPTLFLYGNSDERFPPKILSWIARTSEKNNPAVSIQEIDGGHFLSIKQREKFLASLNTWLMNVIKKSESDTQESSRTSSSS